jgi:hypothetical protein
MLCGDRAKTTCVAVALVAREWELAPAYREPAAGAWLDVDDEPDRARIARCCSCSLLVCELRFEPSAQEMDCAAYGAFPSRRSARWRRVRSNESRRVRSACVKVASRIARCSFHLTRSARVI